jgi:DNA-binding MurR/RpiR family transcriptional regulator
MARETNKEKVLAALIETNSIRAASQLSQVSESTIYRFLKDKEFLTEYRDLRLKTVEMTVARLQALTSEATETLQRNLHSENAQAEIRAASVILDNSFRGVEFLDLVQRIKELEYVAREQIEQARKPNRRSAF